MVVSGRGTPAVTIIIPTYNWSTVLPCSIGSVLDQTLADFELLVIGDRCTDDSAEVVAAVDDPRIRWHNLDVRTGHQSGPNNEGIRMARAPIIAYLGHDDLWLPHHLGTLVAAIQRGADMAYAQTAYVETPEEPPRIEPPADSLYEPGAWIPPTAVVHTRSAVLGAGGWRHPRETGTLDPESDLWTRMGAARGAAPVFVPRLTSVKMPASRRKDVYRLRPTDEQEAWLSLIRHAADPEAALRAKCKAQPRRARIAAALRIRTRARRRGAAAPVTSAEERALRAREFKGVSD